MSINDFYSIVFFNRALTSVNLLNNDLGEGAAAVAAAAEQQGNIKTLCGIRADQIAADFSRKGGWSDKSPCLNAADAALLSFDLKFNRSLTSLDLWRNGIGAGGAEAIAAALPQS